MSENKCPMPGCDGEIIYHGTGFGTDYDSWHGCTKCHFMCDLDHLTRLAAAMELAKARAAYESADGTTHKDEEIYEMWDDVTSATKRVLEVWNG